jgi:hypothetical protein
VFASIHGASLIREELKACYAVIRHNVRTYESAGVMEVLRGRPNAESALRKFESCQDSADRHEGWRYFLEKTSLKPGSDPAEATAIRQEELELRESKAMEEIESPLEGSGMPRGTRPYLRT